VYRDYKRKADQKELVAEDTMAFYFAKPDGFDFRAGQLGFWGFSH
jgi:ferredoxin-NADP reductase